MEEGEERERMQDGRGRMGIRRGRIRSRVETVECTFTFSVNRKCTNKLKLDSRDERTHEPRNKASGRSGSSTKILEAEAEAEATSFKKLEAEGEAKVLHAEAGSGSAGSGFFSWKWTRKRKRKL